MLSTSNDLMMCTACGAQYEVTEDVGMEECRICEVLDRERRTERLTDVG